MIVVDLKMMTIITNTGKWTVKLVFIVKWFVDLGATLDASGFARFSQHANRKPQ